MTSGPVVIGLTTVRARLAGVVEVLRSLLAQTTVPDEIRLHLSREPFAFDAGVLEQDLPPEIRRWREEGRVRVVWTPNLGPYRKIVPMLAEFRDRAARLVSADDDIVYPPDWLEKLVAAAERHPDAVIAHRAREARMRDGRLARYQSWPIAGRLSPELSSIFLPTGNGGVLYRPRFFDGRVLDAAAFQRLCPLSDDVWLRAATLAGRVPVARASRAAKRFREVSNPGPRLWDAALASDATNIVLARALSHFGLSPSAFATTASAQRRLSYPLARTVGDPRAGGRRPIRSALAWAGALRSHLRRPDPAAANVAFSVAPGSAAEAGACFASIRRYFPDAPVWVETAPPLGEGGRHVAGVLRRFLAAPGADILIRLSPAARLWRPLRFFPIQEFFGVAGAVGIRRGLAQRVVSSGIADDEAYAAPSRWAPDDAIRARAETCERFLNDPDVFLIVEDMMRRAGAVLAAWPDVRAGDVWPRGNFLNAWAVTLPMG